eukprot:759445-Hanusia_phi.AAC.1
MPGPGRQWTGGRGGLSRAGSPPSEYHRMGNMQDEDGKEDMVMKREIWGEAVDPSLRRKETLIEKLRAHVWINLDRIQS